MVGVQFGLTSIHSVDFREFGTALGGSPLGGGSTQGPPGRMGGGGPPQNCCGTVLGTHFPGAFVKINVSYISLEPDSIGQRIQRRVDGKDDLDPAEDQDNKNPSHTLSGKMKIKEHTVDGVCVTTVNLSPRRAWEVGPSHHS